MDIKEQFEELAIRIGFDIYEENAEFFYAETRMAFELFQAAKSQATPERFVLMPIKPTETMVMAVAKEHEGDAFLPYSLYDAFVRQAMIEAQEQSHELD
ncbi:hypothetical protein ASC84_19125 [Acinetobacter sp. Root1280]|uniref:hypothetical protein n=1 Tax=Acinetobacter sp. Root1280 TaxID=1736444 RepID=UPI0006F92A14|nr:hypothetical protein [Acinetobacter sp. Root1280]KQX00141.1 hypothetical protein ASC84_19125 [Acinetobacter sp. Root1280]